MAALTSTIESKAKEGTQTVYTVDALREFLYGDDEHYVRGDAQIKVRSPDGTLVAVEYVSSDVVDGELVVIVVPELAGEDR